MRMESPEEESPKGTSTRRAKLKTIAFYVLLSLFSLSVLVFPAIYIMNKSQNIKITEEYKEKIDATDESRLNEEFGKVIEYNERYNEDYTRGIRWEALDDKESRDLLYMNDNSLGSVGTMSIPSINLKDVPITKSTLQSMLFSSIGVVEWGQFPADNETSNTVMLGHSGLGIDTLFGNLTKVNDGDSVFIYTLGRVLEYKVIRTEKMSPAEADLTVKPTKGKNLITLITCIPFGLDINREVVTAELVSVKTLERKDDNRVDLIELDKATGERKEVAGLTPTLWVVIIVTASLVIFLIINNNNKGRKIKNEENNY